MAQLAISKAIQFVCIRQIRSNLIGHLVQVGSHDDFVVCIRQILCVERGRGQLSEAIDRFVVCIRQSIISRLSVCGAVAAGSTGRTLSNVRRVPTIYFWSARPSSRDDSLEALKFLAALLNATRPATYRWQRYWSKKPQQAGQCVTTSSHYVLT